MVNHQTCYKQKHHTITRQHIWFLRYKRPQHNRFQRPLTKRRHNSFSETNKNHKPLRTNNDHTRQLQIPSLQISYRNSRKTQHWPRIPTTILTKPKPHRIHLESYKKRIVTIIHRNKTTNTSTNRKTLQKILTIKNIRQKMDKKIPKKV